MSALFDHQARSLAFLKDCPRALDFSDCGTGKTRVQIEDIKRGKEAGEKSTLVLCPKSIMQPAWAEDLERFAPELTYSLAYAEVRQQAFDVDADVYITNHDAVNWLSLQKPSFFQRFSRLVIDESTAYKHHTSQRSKALKKITRYFPVRRALTATPNTNSITDIWHQVLVVDDGKRLGTSFYQFRNATCAPLQIGPQPNMVKWDDRPGAEDAVTALLADIVIRHKLEECTDIPENHEYPVRIRLEGKHLAQYRQLERDSILLLQEKTIDAINGAVLYSKLLQVASGAVYAGDHSYAVLDTKRSELILDLVEQRRQCVVFFNWVHQRDQLSELGRRRGLAFAVIDGSVSSVHKKNEIVADFQKGLYKFLLIHPQSGAHGLTLTAATTTIWASPTFNLEHYHQGVKRIHRAGQREVTETLVVTAHDTVDEEVFARCKAKQLRMNDLLTALKENAA